MENTEKVQRPIYKKPWFWLIATFLVLFIVSLSGQHPSNNAVSKSIQRPPTLSDQITIACDTFATGTPVTLSYKELEKSPDNFSNQYARFTGQVLQIQELDNLGYMRLAIVKNEFGDWDLSHVLYVQYTGNTEAVEDDVVTVTGVMEGSHTYTSQANYQITVPSMYACSVKKIS